ncbi:MAG: branched-chain amino acid aminotransferase [Sphingobacteriales bacterium]|jgi:branched-chain amino acid aminotransferase
MEVMDTTQDVFAGIDMDNIKFGEIFSKNMIVADYKDGKWGDFEIMPYGNMEFSPAMSSLHYGQIVFEGMKAFYSEKNDCLNVFRIDKHHERMNRSNERLCIPEIDQKDFKKALTDLLIKDRDWVPKRRGYSLYIRPFVFSTDPFLGVKVSETYRFMIIASPVGAYFKEGMNPVRLITAQKYSRAVEGGLGETKTPANYAATMKPSKEAKARGFAQVLWLDGKDKTYIDEVGTMNIFFRIGEELITPPLGGTILAGVTRNSIIQLAKEWDIKITERKVSIAEICEGIEKGTVTEVFGTGTAAVISAVGEINHNDHSYIINEGKVGDYAKRFLKEITGIQYGEIEDTHNWITKI